MSLQIAVTTGKSDDKKPSAGLVRRTETDTSDKHPQVNVTELIGTLFSQVRSSIENEADVEIELNGNVEFTTKDGNTVMTFDVSGESANARTMRLKFSTKIRPEPEKPAEKV